MKIGSLALRQVQDRNDADRVRAEKERLIEKMNQLTSETPRAIAIDWSGEQKPNEKIWAAVAVGSRLEVLQMKKSREDAIDWLIEQLKQQPNTIAGLDFAFSMPAWFVRKHGCDNAIDFWAVAEREGEHWLKYCPYPFWGCKGTRKPRNCDCKLFRETEKAVRNPAEKASPTSTFQLVGPSQVGRGSIRGMPFLTQLRSAGIAVWPFDEPRQEQAVVVEIYPRLFMGKLKKSNQAERRRFLEDRYPDMEPEHRDCAVKSDDAFDAAVSALALATRRATPRLLANAKLEGQFWF